MVVFPRFDVRLMIKCDNTGVIDIVNAQPQGEKTTGVKTYSGLIKVASNGGARHVGYVHKIESTTSNHAAVSPKCKRERSEVTSVAVHKQRRKVSWSYRRHEMLHLRLARRHYFWLKMAYRSRLRALPNNAKYLGRLLFGKFRSVSLLSLANLCKALVGIFSSRSFLYCTKSPPSNFHTTMPIWQAGQADASQRTRRTRQLTYIWQTGVIGFSAKHFPCNPSFHYCISLLRPNRLPEIKLGRSRLTFRG